MSAIVYLVGAGPGDPGLITVKGKQAIENSDVIIYDRLASPQLLQYAKSDVEKIYVGKLPDRHTLTQEEINELIVIKAKEGKVITRLKGGDPFIFGRGGEEAERLVEEGIPFQVVPGITSAIAVPAYAGIPVTHRDFNSSFAIVTGHERPEKTESSINWEKLSTATETIIFLMGVSNLPYIVKQLTKYGRDLSTPIALIRWGTRIEQVTLVGTLANIVQKVETANFGSPATIIVGEVVKLREKLTWFEQKPLFGKRVLVTRARSQSSVLSEQIGMLGGEPIEFPVIRIEETEDVDAFDQAFQQLATYDWVIFTSVNGVNHFFQQLQKSGVDIRQMSKARIASIGPKTAAELIDKGLVVEALPAEYKAEALVDYLRPLIQAGDKILLPRADIAREVLAIELRNLGCELTEIAAYRTKIDAVNAEEIVTVLKRGQIDILTFTSSSTVHNFMKAIGSITSEIDSLIRSTQIACIGPITAKTAKDQGLQVDVIAKDYTIDGLVEAIKTL